jgi:hypothetical protein
MPVDQWTATVTRDARRRLTRDVPSECTPTIRPDFAVVAEIDGDGSAIDTTTPEPRRVCVCSRALHQDFGAKKL